MRTCLYPFVGEHTERLEVKTRCIKKICEIPVEFKQRDVSVHTLAQESDFEAHYESLGMNDIKDYLKQNPQLVIEWAEWSADKRTNGYYLLFNLKPTIGFINVKGIQTFVKTFESELDACSEYIYKEVSAILDLNIK